MKNNKDKKYIIGMIILILLIFLFIFLLIKFKNKDNIKEYSRNYFYMDTFINVKVYLDNEKEANKALDEIDNIYKNYHELTDRYNSYDNGLYNLNNGNNNIDSKLYDMIIYADSWYEKSNGLLNIGIGNLVDVWKKYRDKGVGVPTSQELKSAIIDHKYIKIDDTITLKNKIQIDLGAVSKGYTTQKVGEYLKSVGIKKYIINAGGNILAGDYYKSSDKNYIIGIENPTDNNSLYQIVKINNKAVVTSGGYQRNYTYNGVTYNHIINPDTLYPANYMESVTVISDSSSDADCLSTILFLMDVDSGKEFIKDYDAEAIWYLKDGTVIKTEGFSKYE